jgi:hypothetical protein
MALLGGCAGHRAAAHSRELLVSSDRHAPETSASLRDSPCVPSLLASIGWFSFPLLFSAAHALALASSTTVDAVPRRYAVSFLSSALSVNIDERSYCKNETRYKLLTYLCLDGNGCAELSAIAELSASMIGTTV